MEAEADLPHGMLGRRLLETARTMLAHRGQEADRIPGRTDTTKLLSRATLFAVLSAALRALLDAFHREEKDPLTPAVL